jgi:hypothetical protein
MDPLLLIAGGALCVGVVFSVVGAWVAGQKGRSTTEGAVLGFMLGPLGALIVALLPNGSIKKSGLSRSERWDTAPDPEWLRGIGGQQESPETAWLRELENRHRPKP